MNCPKCNSRSTHVINSYDVGYTRRRRYECWECGHRFTTREVVAKRETEEKKHVEV